MLRKYMPLLAVIIALMVFGLLIYRHQTHLNQGVIIYAKLAPLDPRSLIQGDYVALNYELYIDDVNYPLIDKHIDSKVVLDHEQKIIKTYLDGRGDVKLRLKGDGRRLDGLYPAVRSFLFAEGLGACYEQGEYAKLSVLPNGVSMLVDLVDGRLQPLNCEQRLTAQTD
ncbi:GDYXXLXY domain-containing protein [Moraxella nasovis]|uniref:GDYXXLXY domain-containing protein n=1 Tax=Moraxella nasovis TaxID=2904121 RepID=UPI001F61B5E7|nr:GDYXXLXY domain-containing protein [Moraxella nasovis]UNU74066.1 GDYXXLXY domain-containing protein [Moraxella nasovis]